MHWLLDVCLFFYTEAVVHKKKSDFFAKSKLRFYGISISWISTLDSICAWVDS